MGKIDLFQLEAAVEELNRVSRSALAVQRELSNLPAGNPGTKNGVQILEDEAKALSRASEALQQILFLYTQTEQRVLDTVNGEYPVIPRTVFGISRFENLQPYEALMPIAAPDAAYS